MGAWADLTIDVEDLQGHAEYLLVDRQDGGLDGNVITTARLQTAKQHLRTALLQHGGLKQHVDDAGSLTDLFDDVAGESALESDLKNGYALSFLSKFAGDDAVFPGGRTAERQEQFEDELKDWAMWFGDVSASALGYTSKTSSGVTGGAFATSTNRHERLS
jgi:hypothetical protein